MSEENEPSVIPDSAGAELELKGTLFRGTLSLGAAATLQRGLSYLGVLIAARVAGPVVLGRYSTAIATASLVAGVAGLSAGAVGARFAGQYPKGSEGHRSFIRSLVSYLLCTGLTAATALYFLAPYIAEGFLSNPHLASDLRFAAFASAGFILWEGANGLLIGLLHFKPVLALSLGSGVTLLVGLAIAASHGAGWMLLAQATAGLLPALVVIALALKAAGRKASKDRPRVRDLLRFGSIQSIAGISVGIASWLVISLLARHDETGRSVGLYTIGQQMNSLAVLLPSFFLQLVVPLVTRPGRSQERTYEVVGVTSFSAMILSLSIGGVLLIGAPTFVDAYGPSFGAGSKAAVFLVAAAIIAASSGATGNALLAHHVKRAAAITVSWALVLTVVAWFLVPTAGPSGAGIAWICAQLISGFLVLFTSFRASLVPGTVSAAWVATSGAACAIAGLGYFRASGHSILLALAQVAILCLSLAIVWIMGRRPGYIPSLNELWTKRHALRVRGWGRGS